MYLDERSNHIYVCTTHSRNFDPRGLGYDNRVPVINGVLLVLDILWLLRDEAILFDCPFSVTTSFSTSRSDKTSKGSDGESQIDDIAHLLLALAAVKFVLPCLSACRSEIPSSHYTSFISRALEHAIWIFNFLCFTRSSSGRTLASLSSGKWTIGSLYEVLQL